MKTSEGFLLQKKHELLSCFFYCFLRNNKFKRDYTVAEMPILKGSEILLSSFLR
jgi:hypothetical protein